MKILEIEKKKWPYAVSMTMNLSYYECQLCITKPDLYKVFEEEDIEPSPCLIDSFA